MNKKSKIILALDTNNLKKIKKIISLISEDIYAVKVGYQFYFNFGAEGIKIIQRYKLKIFFDFKLHDIPNTTLMGIKQIMKYKPDMLTLHISGGKNMLSLAKAKSKKIKLIGVSVLTSLDNKNMKSIYNRKNIEILIKDMVKLALKAKISGIVCSPKEIELVKKISKNKLIIITPGIRIDTGKIKNDDQKRTLTPKKALNLGADYIVIGRPILNSKNPKKLVQLINEKKI